MLKFLIHGLESVILPLPLNPCLILVAEVSQSSTPLYSHEAPHSSNHEAEEKQTILVTWVYALTYQHITHNFEYPAEVTICKVCIMMIV